MSQHDQVITNADGATVRADINSALAALFGMSSGATAPATTVAYQPWADTTTGILKQRNAANSGWVSIANMADWSMPVLTASGGSALVGFLQAGTGAAARTLQAKGRDVVSVKDFGATGDGVADDTAEIQAALDSGAKLILVPAGTYLVTSGLAMASNQVLAGDGQGACIKAGANALSVISATSKSNVHVRDLLIDGGGQTVDVSTGIRAAVGIAFNNCTNFSAINAEVKKCGIKNSAAPTTDSGYGGFGIFVSASTGASAHGLIENCYVHDIAGGGTNTGDGIYISGSNANTAITTKAVTVRDCRVSTVGRHCYAIAEGAGTSIPTDIWLTGCYAEKAALCGIDFEDGYNSVVQGCSFSACGNDQTYFDPATALGATYRLLAGIAIGNSDKNITIDGCHFNGCYYGINWGGADGVVLANSKIESSTTQDIKTGLASSPKNLRISNCEFASTTANTSVISGNQGSSTISDSLFAGEFGYAGGTAVVIKGNTFKKGFKFNGSGNGGCLIDGNTFTDFAGAAISFGSTGWSITGLAVRGNHFLGAGNLTYGIQLADTATLGMDVTGNFFSALTTAGLGAASGTVSGCVRLVDNNHFKGCAAGIAIGALGLSNAKISNNAFEGGSGWGIDIATTSGNTLNLSIVNNIFSNSQTNGVQISVTSGGFDYTILHGNDVHYCSGTKWTIAAGNANGISANNITT